MRKSSSVTLGLTLVVASAGMAAASPDAAIALDPHRRTALASGASDDARELSRHAPAEVAGRYERAGFGDTAKSKATSVSSAGVTSEPVAVILILGLLFGVYSATAGGGS